MNLFEHKKQSKTLKWSLIIAIIIVLNLFFNYALSLVYPAPEYLAYCPTEQVVTPPTTKNECLNAGGQWTENTYPQNQPKPQSMTTSPNSSQVTVSGYCNENYTCSNNFEAVRKVYDRNVFIVLVILGVISLLFGLFLKVTDAVTIGLSLGGILSLVIASIRYWSAAENVLKVIILAVALAALIWVGIKKFAE